MNNFQIEENKFDNSKFEKFMNSLLDKNDSIKTSDDYSEYVLVNLLKFYTNSVEKNNEYTTETKENEILDKNKKEEVIFNVFKNEKEEKSLIKKDYEFLVKYIKLSSINNSIYNSIIEDKIMDIYDNYGTQFLSEVLQQISLDYFNQPKMLSVICDCLHIFDLDEVSPWGPILLSSYVGNKSEELKSDAIYLISSWFDKSLIPLLKGIDCTSKWLKDYVEEVIEMLEE